MHTDSECKEAGLIDHRSGAFYHEVLHSCLFLLSWFGPRPITGMKGFAPTGLLAFSSQRQTEAERQKILWEWKELNGFLEEQEQFLLDWLQELDRDIVQRRDEEVCRLSREICLLSDKKRGSGGEKEEQFRQTLLVRLISFNGSTCFIVIYLLQNRRVCVGLIISPLGLLLATEDFLPASRLGIVRHAEKYL